MSQNVLKLALYIGKYYHSYGKNQRGGNTTTAIRFDTMISLLCSKIFFDCSLPDAAPPRTPKRNNKKAAKSELDFTATTCEKNGIFCVCVECDGCRYLTVATAKSSVLQRSETVSAPHLYSPENTLRLYTKKVPGN